MYASSYRSGWVAPLAMLATLIALAWSDSASAQAWLSDRARTEGRGIRLGDFELHPGIGSEIGYDSNVFLAHTAEEDSAILRVAPHLYLSTLSGERAAVGGGAPPTLRFRTGVSGALKHYFATDQGTDLAIGQDARLELLPERKFSVEFFENYTRSIDPFVDPADPTGMGAADYGRDELQVGTKLVLASEGGLLKGGLGYTLGIDHFEGSEFSSNRSNRHTISAESVYEFLPKTGLIWNGSFALHNFVNASPTATLSRNDARLVSTKIGLNGGLTERVGFTIAVGYGAGFFDDGADYESVIGQIETRFRATETLMWSLGYDREYNTAFQGNFARLDRPRTALQLGIGGTVVVGAKAEVTFVDFGDETAGSRNDIHLLTNANGEYRVTDWLGITGELGYLRNFTDYAFSEDVNGTAPGGVQLNPAEYARWEAWLGLRAFL